ncbi:trichohyalin [Strigomonas culicis]|uniref:Trichohyalin n=1 Tax=Strigomonas culicis TaxID=28005 RepID=S9W640_9TRYP|nr:trichohyalin [Strigomonas culicis]EPY34681.1 trichohyalin [Strigomonas culicis]|eukprot:EPY20979.1 trichohyalin [Strigomonas culicis]
MDMWEKMLAIGFNSVLTNLRLKPLKKIFSELSVPLPDLNSTEECCKALVYAAFPREEIRAKVSRQKNKKVMFVVPPEKMYVKGDMGFITFEIHNVSEVFAKKSERYYSPEFTYADLKWSVLCMIYEQSNLALYLCQTGSVHCKFIITLVNHLNVDDSILNEGTQSFLAISQENDWGFNNVIKFVDLLNPEQGFLNTARDSITIEVGIVLVESIKAAPKEKPAPAKEKKNGTKEAQAALQRLLEDEQAEANRKKVKQEISKTIKDEEKTRKDLAQRAQKAYHDLQERQRQEAKRVQRELVDRDRREEQERQREQEALRQARQTKEALQRQLEDLRKDDVELQQQHKVLTQNSKNAKKSSEKLGQDLKAVQDKLSAVQASVKQQERKLEAARKRLQAAQADMPKTPSASSEDEMEEEEEESALDDDNDLLDEDMHRLIGEVTADY